MSISSNEPYGDSAGDYAFASSPFAPSYAQQPTTSLFTDLNPSGQGSEYALPQNYNPYSVDLMPPTLATASDQTPFSLSGPQFYPPDGVYNEPGSSQVVDNSVHWNPGLDGLSLGGPSGTYGMEDPLDTEGWLSPQPTTSGFTGSDSGLNYDSGTDGVVLGSSSTNDGSARTTPSHEKRPRASVYLRIARVQEEVSAEDRFAAAPPIGTSKGEESPVRILWKILLEEGYSWKAPRRWMLQAV
ncbi:hypothetical protein O988_01813 [Pseudogymnoascus sp. VKM F-3808]|nr:hypothetical protein O988_01813 [Pseudogymnoascus sp. VKM F-3808]